MMRILAFVLALLLLAGSVDPTRGWLIVLVVLTGVAAMRLRPWAPFDVRPALDVRLASFVLAVLLLAGTVDPTKDWLIALSAVTGVAAFMPHVLSLEQRESRWRPWRGGMRRHRHRQRWADTSWAWDWDWDGGWRSGRGGDGERR
jgi:hypothetical protein